MRELHEDVAENFTDTFFPISGETYWTCVQALAEAKLAELRGELNEALLKIDKASLVEPRVKTTPTNVNEAHEALFHCTMTLPAAAKHCGMTQKELKMTFFEYLKYNPVTFDPEVSK